MPNPLEGKMEEAKAYMQAVGMWCNKSIKGEDDTAEIEDLKAKQQVLLDLGVPVYAIELLRNMIFKKHAEIVGERVVQHFFKDEG